MRKYRVLITAKAEGDVDSVLAWFSEQGAEIAGAKWFARLMGKSAALETMPQRCALAAESADLNLEIREVLIGKRRGAHRLLFQIDGNAVHILRVWHSARDAIRRGDL